VSRRAGSPDDLRPRLGASTVLATLALLSALFLVALAIGLALRQDWVGDWAEEPMIIALVTDILAAFAGAVASIRRVSKVPNWQWKAELGASIVSVVLPVGLVLLFW
jgi:hypothetical protein